jgi:dienelactone hydrolase
MRYGAAAALALAAWLAAGDASGRDVRERVRFESLALGSDAPVVVDALLFRPRGDALRDRPAVVALHGCGGLYRSDAPQRLTPRHASRAASLVAAGYVVLLPDSLGSRGLREICTVRTTARRVTPAERRRDALGALRWLARQPGIDRERIAVFGWSHGGSTVLATIDASHADVVAFRERADAPPFFRAAIALYPGCGATLRDGRWRPAAPVRILIGEADDWTPAKPCVDLAERARAAQWPLETTVYPGAYHGFDAPGGELTHRRDVPGGVVPGAGVHVGPDPAARDDANRRIEAFLRDTIGAPGG